ncbi:MAG: hypothetical protein JXB24_08335 [Bacteroidales bacterium]|nr:hypothetical protein [Bacteroidales bacterium]
MFFKKKNINLKDVIQEKLKHADVRSLIKSKKNLAVAILHEIPLWDSSNNLHDLAANFVQQYQSQNWIPRNLNVDNNTIIKMRQLIAGKEISSNAGLDTATSNKILSEMLSIAVQGKKINNISTIAFSGRNTAMGQTFFAILAK